MSDIIYGLTNRALAVLDGGWIFLIALALELVLFIAIMLAALFIRLYSIKKRKWYFLSSIAVLALELAFLSLSQALALFYATLGVTLVLWCVIALIPERKLKVTDKQRELVRSLDGLRNENLAERDMEENQTQEQKESSQTMQAYEDSSRFELDFQHVKLVIEKLEYYPLSASDRKLVRELEENVCSAENEGFTNVLKNKINDGLGALLKIMSKHGV